MQRIKELKNKERFSVFSDLYEKTRQNLIKREIKANSGIVQQSIRKFFKHFSKQKEKEIPI